MITRAFIADVIVNRVAPIIGFRVGMGQAKRPYHSAPVP